MCIEACPKGFLVAGLYRRPDPRKRQVLVRQVIRVLDLVGLVAAFRLGLGGLMGLAFHLPWTVRLIPCTSAIWAARQDSALPPLGHPGLAGLIHVGDTPS